MKYMAIANETIQIATPGVRPPFMEGMRASEIYFGRHQAPLTIGNLKRFIESDWPTLDDKLLAAELLYNKQFELTAARKALRLKNTAERDGESLYCDVVSYDDSNLDPIAKALGAKGERKVLFENLSKHVKNYRPFSQQLIGANYIIEQRRCEILYDMRVGKTLTWVIAFKELLARGEVTHGMVVCPKPIAESVWANELVQQGLSCYILENGRKADEATLSYQDVDVYIISFESLVQRLGIITSILDMEMLAVCADETSKLKNPAAKRTKAFHALTFWSKYVTLLTGTPMEQGPMDFQPQRYAVDRGASMGSTYADFAQRFCVTAGNGKKVLRRGVKMTFELAIQSKSLRYVRSEADQFAGKDKNFRYIHLAPTIEQVNATNDVLNGLVRLNEEDSGSDINSHILTTMGYLREICCGYNKIKIEDDGPYSRFRFPYDSKTLWLEAWAESNPGVPALIFCEFDEHEEMISEMLDRNNQSYVWVKRDSKRYGNAEVIRMFNEGEVRFMLMKTGQGYGMTLNRIPAVEAGLGSYPVMIYVSPTWSLGSFLQSQDRCVGVDPSTGKNICTPIFVLNVASSIENRIVEALRGKGSVQETLLKDKDRDGFSSFVDSLRLDPESISDDVHFDPEEIHARRVLKISPQRKCTHRIIRKACPQLKNEPGIIDATQPTIAAGLYLLSKFNEDGSTKVRHERREHSVEEEFASAK